MSKKQKSTRDKKLRVVLERFARVLVAGIAGAVITYLPDAIDAFDVPDSVRPWVAIALAGAITALDKLRRWGQDPGEK